MQEAVYVHDMLIGEYKYRTPEEMELRLAKFYGRRTVDFILSGKGDETFTNEEKELAQ